MVQLITMPRDEDGIFYDYAEINCYDSIEEALKALKNKLSEFNKIEFIYIHNTSISMRATKNLYRVWEEYIIITSCNKIYNFTKKDVEFFEKFFKVRDTLRVKL